MSKKHVWLSEGAFLDLFNNMLALNPEHRISPDDVLEHAFMKGFVPHFEQEKAKPCIKVDS